MTPAEKIMLSLRGGHSDSVPFTIYEKKLPQCRAERNMRNRGMCIVNRQIPVVKIHTPNVKKKQEVYVENGKTKTRTYIETPIGSLTTLTEAAGYTTWIHEKMFKTPADYKTLLFIIKDEIYEPCYDILAKAQQADAGDTIFRAGFGLEPLQTFISGGYMDMQDFCIEWMDNRDEILKLYDAVVENRRKIYPLIAASPASHANYGGNVVSSIIGLKAFEKYYVQHYNEAAEVMHKRGKFIGCHFDDNCRLISQAIGNTDLDYIEAFTPSPDTDMTLGEARKAWPDKVLWLNFPSSVHLKSDKEVEQKTVDMLNELDSVDGVIMGITEDIPEERWRNSCTSIMDGLSRHAQENPALYS